MRGFVLSLCIIVTLGYLGTIAVLQAQLTQGCSGHLKQAADASTIELAKTKLGQAINYAEDNGMVGGYTKIIWRTPDEDVGYWYNNLKASLQELEAVKPDASQLERTNVLMKLRETLLDQTRSGDSVTIPDGLSRFPHNTLFALWGIISIVLAFVGFVVVADILD